MSHSGTLVDYIDINDEDEQVPPRFNKDSKVITNGRLPVGLCKIIESVLANGKLNNRKSGDYTCSTQRGNSNGLFHR